ncbi:MAG: molybdopterin molybdotransferase MoeA [Erythrobacter sp.]
MVSALSLEEAQARILALAPVLPTQHVPVQDALGRYLAEDVHAARTQPPADLSAMDGYAICGDGPWHKLGESRAGAPFAGTLTAGQCVRISTGAHVPRGADRIVLQEDAAIAGETITAAELPPPARHIRAKGFDFSQGDVVLRRGSHITPAAIALAIAAGRATITAARAPRVAILDTGDELSPDPAACAPHQIPASNGAMLAAMLAPFGCDLTGLGPVGDNKPALAEALARAEDADVLITSGGASVGDHDLVQAALDDWGAQIAFWRVAIKPGKPLMVATRGAQIIIGLPGNPVSCFVTCFLFALPLVRAMMGSASPLPDAQAMVTGAELPAVGARREFLRSRITGGKAHPVASQDSSALKALAEADCLIDRPAHSPAVPIGSPVFGYRL